MIIKSNHSIYAPDNEEQIGQEDWDDHQSIREYFCSQAGSNVQSFLKQFETILNFDYRSQKFEKLINSFASAFFNCSSRELKLRAAAPDDRPLYWIRQEILVKLKIYCKEKRLSRSLPRWLRLFEEGSRNYTGISYKKAPKDSQRILITGFDPFLLNSKAYPGKHNHRQSNPSGCVALSLHDTFTPNHKGFIQAMIFPVRYRDFDGSSCPASGQGTGVVERYIGPWIGKVDLIVTISQGTPDSYDIDQFATLSRGGLIDNLGFTRQKNSPCMSGGPPWIDTTLPRKMIKPPLKINDTFHLTPSSPPSKGFPDNPENTVFSGPGGNYLSNEIFYRVAHLRELWKENQRLKKDFNPEKCTGHFHIPKLQDPSKILPDGSIGEDIDYPATAKLIRRVRLAIHHSL